MVNQPTSNQPPSNSVSPKTGGAANPSSAAGAPPAQTTTAQAASAPAKPRNLADVLREFADHQQKMRDELGKVIVGQTDTIEQLLAAIFTRGHCLLEGVPGLAKTLMVSTLAQILDVNFKRVQFTPDLMPSDITGTQVLEEDESGKRLFRFVEGPIFTNILLADEINRTPPKTQAALLEAMQERQVSIGRDTHTLPDPFFTIATQNPVEQEGTYPLPEAQLDRFMFNIKIDYPTAEEEERILTATTRGDTATVNKVLSARAILNCQKLVSSIAAGPLVIRYAAKLVRATRPADESAPEYVRELVDWGAGPRAGQNLIAGAKAIAAMNGRFNVEPGDIHRIALPVLRHRIATNFQAQAEGMNTDAVITRLLQDIEIPEPPKMAK
ncbi:methanol dehydrogenase regulator (moxR)-like protein [Rhodopirellula sallentina SM41]|uniref:Methanol dehydrogenase regulator (MoxR)-like protein n=1 Tax=Rhodopirellula sallentina SM41 TaxID=1263870 RepID=M5TUJ1_9BACT|nr:methanol dehydrogenase regulator (moxR)-like protein [Rhodopirellula sallentina SM41]